MQISSRGETYFSIDSANTRVNCSLRRVCILVLTKLQGAPTKAKCLVVVAKVVEDYQPIVYRP